MHLLFHTYQVKGYTFHTEGLLEAGNYFPWKLKLPHLV